MLKCKTTLHSSKLTEELKFELRLETMCLEDDVNGVYIYLIFNSTHRAAIDCLKMLFGC